MQEENLNYKRAINFIIHSLHENSMHFLEWESTRSIFFRIKATTVGKEPRAIDTKSDKSSGTAMARSPSLEATHNIQGVSGRLVTREDNTRMSGYKINSRRRSV